MPLINPIHCKRLFPPKTIISTETIASSQRIAKDCIRRNDRFIAIDPLIAIGRSFNRDRSIDPLIANKNIENDPSLTIHHDDPLQTIHRERFIANNPSRPIHREGVIANDSLPTIHRDRSFNQVRVITNDRFLATDDRVSSRTII